MLIIKSFLLDHKKCSKGRKHSSDCNFQEFFIDINNTVAIVDNIKFLKDFSWSGVLTFQYNGIYFLDFKVQYPIDKMFFYLFKILEDLFIQDHVAFEMYQNDHNPNYWGGHEYEVFPEPDVVFELKRQWKDIHLSINKKGFNISETEFAQAVLDEANRFFTTICALPILGSYPRIKEEIYSHKFATRTDALLMLGDKFHRIGKDDDCRKWKYSTFEYKEVNISIFDWIKRLRTLYKLT